MAGATSSERGARTGGELLIDQLARHGVEHVFAVPGESFLAALDALRDRALRLTVCRHEGGAAMMAEAVGKLTGRPGVCLVARGPGATNAAHGLHLAQQDSTPMIALVGQVARGSRERDALQELSYRDVFGSICKWVAEIDDPARIPELVSRAFYTATAGRPGPVLLALPEDVLAARAEVPDAPPFAPVETWPGARELEALGARLRDARAPVVLAGGSRWSAAAVAALHRFAERFALPVATTFRRDDLFDALHPSYAGDLGVGPNPALRARVAGADVVLAIGGRLGEVTSQGYELLDIPDASHALVHVHPGAEELGRVYRPALAIHASPAAFCPALDTLPPPRTPPWRAATAAAHAEYLAWSETATPQPGEVNLGELVVWLRAHLPAHAIITTGAGSFTAWVHRFFRFRRHGQLAAPVAGAMGYGLPAAIAARLLDPDRPVVCVTGDGDFLMTGQELVTAVQYRLRLTVVVVDNRRYGTIRVHQERAYPGRAVATDLHSPDFAAQARACGAAGFTVARTADFAAAFRAAQACAGPALIHVEVDPRTGTPEETLDEIRTRARAQPA